MITLDTLETEWLGNLARRRRRTVQDLTDWLMLEVAAGPREGFYGALELAPHQLLKKKTMLRYFAPLLAFVWKQALLATHPAKEEMFLGAMERAMRTLKGSSRRQVAVFRNDLDFFQTITDLFAEEGFLSVALHVVQRVQGEIEQRPENLVMAVGLNQWLDEQYHLFLEQLVQVEIMTG